MKRIINTLSRKWPEYLLEILVLIIGIYGAFELENWNDSVNNTQKSESLRRGLIAEFENNLSDLNTALRVHARSAESGIEFLRLISAKEEVYSDTGDSLMKAFFNAWTFNPRNGALRTGVSSGDIHLLADEALLELLFEWEDMVNDAVEDEKYGVNNLLNFLYQPNPYLEWQNILGTEAQPWIDSSDYEKLLAEASFKYFVSVQIVFHQGAHKELIQLKKANEKILELLKKRSE